MTQAELADLERLCAAAWETAELAAQHFSGPDLEFIKAARRALPELIADNREMRRLLIQFGNHYPHCPDASRPEIDPQTCVCGFAEIVGQLR